MVAMSKEPSFLPTATSVHVFQADELLRSPVAPPSWTNRMIRPLDWLMCASPSVASSPAPVVQEIPHPRLRNLVGSSHRVRTTKGPLPNSLASNATIQLLVTPCWSRLPASPSTAQPGRSPTGP